jgi:hypothetical protein
MSPLIGPSNILDISYVASERTENSYFLLFMAIKLGNFVIFTMLYLFSSSQLFLKYFLGYAFCVGFELIFVGNLLPLFFTYPIRGILFFSLDNLGLIFLWYLFESLYEIKNWIQRILMFMMLITINLIILLRVNHIIDMPTGILFNIYDGFTCHPKISLC